MNISTGIMQPYFPLTVHRSEHPEERKRNLLAGLRAGVLPGRQLYQSPAQAQRWQDYHRAWSPSAAGGALAGLYRSVAGEAAGGLNPAPALVVGLGCGDGVKDAHWLEALAGRAGYVPVDGAPDLVLAAAREAALRAPGVKVHPLVADLSAAPELAAWLDSLPAAWGARLYTAFGLLPNMDVAAFLPWLAGLLRPGDRAALSANLSPGGYSADGGRILAQYDNPPARRWYAGALEELGFEARDYELSVSARALDGDAIWRIEVLARLKREVALPLFGESVAFRPGESLAVFHSNRFTPDALRSLLGRGGLLAEGEWIGGSGEEGIFFCRIEA